MTYDEAVDFLFSSTPVFQNIGAGAYKPGLGNALALDEHYGHPHRAFPTIHVGGTNGKGSTSHTLAAVLNAAGYRVGLFTSPHLLDFRERIRVDGVMIPEAYVARFTSHAAACIKDVRPSFFEITTLMALCYFRDMAVDVAVIEVGLGGRLDSTNIITPLLSVITNVSFDHTQYLGSTLSDIAREKAGIIKPSIPVVIGNDSGAETRLVFDSVADSMKAPILYAEEANVLASHAAHQNGGWEYLTSDFGHIIGELGGEVQAENTRTILAALRLFRKHFYIDKSAVARGFANVTKLTGLRGRWEVLSKKPHIICDTAHNEAGIRSVVRQLEAHHAKTQSTVHIIIGMAADKDVRAALALLPRRTGFRYYWTQASVQRALPAEELAKLAESVGLDGATYPSVAAALIEAEANYSSRSELIFVGGSNFIVADLLSITEQEL